MRDLEVGLDVNNPGLSTSDFELAHRVLGQVSYRLQYGGRFGTTFSLLYEGQSGSPYSWIYFRGDDVNGDGFDRADLIYVPNDASEVVVLRDVRDANGRVVWLRRRTRRAPPPSRRSSTPTTTSATRGARSSSGTRRARPGTTSSTPASPSRSRRVRGQRVELTLDIENLFSLLGSSLGEVRTVDFQRYNLVDFRGYDDQGRQIISFDAPE